MLTRNKSVFGRMSAREQSNDFLCLLCIDQHADGLAQDKVKVERSRQRYRGSSDSDDEEDGEESDDEDEEEEEQAAADDDDDEDDAAMYERSYERNWERAAQPQGPGRGGGRAGRPPKPSAAAVPAEPWQEMGRGKFTPVHVRYLNLARFCHRHGGLYASMLLRKARMHQTAKAT